LVYLPKILLKILF